MIAQSTHRPYGLDERELHPLRLVSFQCAHCGTKQHQAVMPDAVLRCIGCQVTVIRPGWRVRRGSH